MEKINCKEIRDSILEETKLRFETLPDYLKEKKMVIITVGNDDASKVYVRNKLKTAEELGINAENVIYSEGLTVTELYDNIHNIAYNPNVGGVILQLPLPQKFKDNTDMYLNVIPMQKDIDGLCMVNKNRQYLDSYLPHITPATAKGVLKLLPEDLSGKAILLIGRGELCNKALITTLINRNATITVKHSKSPELSYKGYDYIVSAVGKAKLFNALDLSENTTVIDIGINRDENGKLCGDLDKSNLDTVLVNGRYTPTPGGTGILTTACVCSNYVDCLTIQDKYNRG